LFSPSREVSSRASAAGACKTNIAQPHRFSPNSEEEEKEKTTPFGVSLMRSQV